MDFAQVMEVTMQGGVLMNEEAIMQGEVLMNEEAIMQGYASMVVEVNLRDELVLVEVIMEVDYLVCWMMEVLVN